jgi:hypothetical protein
MTRTVLPLALAVAACAAPWNRPNTTEAQFRADLYLCQQQAALAYRPAVVPPAPGVKQTDCTAYGSNLSCTTRPGVDTAMYANAANVHAAQAAQAGAVEACMVSRGYRRG